MATFSARHGGAVQKSSQAAAVPFRQTLVLGVATALFGLVVLVWPGETLRVLGALVGIWLLVAGVMRLAAALTDHQAAGRRLMTGVVGAAMVVVGIACLRDVIAGVTALALIVGLAWLLTGLSEIGIGLMTHGRTRVWLTTMGVASLVVGLVFVMWPGATLTAMVLLAGISALVIGCAEIACAFVMRRDAAAVRPVAHP
ncbi:HdeD family acid-resistance protein [Dactylosporangium maewongense]|uniref:HdeD family acid-resistance protein n=1 Tax=Dactylosporangium maewongense TaxID=634393 RepID=A0ABN1ZVM9_9ACTN